MTLFLMDHATQAIIFGIVIFNLATNPNSILRLNHPAIERLGALSYAMYGYNWMTTVISVHIAIRLFGKGLAASIATFISGIILIFVARPFPASEWKNRSAHERQEIGPCCDRLDDAIG